MIVHYPKDTQTYTSITEMHGIHSSMLMNFGLINLSKNQRYTIHHKNNESALLLMDGTVSITSDTITCVITRHSLCDENPHVIHIPANYTVHIESITHSEIALQQTENPRNFSPVLYTPHDIRSETFGNNVLKNSSARIVRTIFNADTAAYSNMVLGEVINFPGCWSSYPPHNHPQPEVYHYRFLPQHGFGFGQAGDTIYKLTHKSTLLIDPWVPHPQTAAPGYAMYYIWMIPHLKDAKFGSDSRQFIEPHTWLLDKDVDSHVWTPTPSKK